jgi:formate hydrogenlyase subunit 3/multisubunit Na+/H+ antiporter MnhD subunit
MALIVAVSLPLLAALLCWVKPLRSIAWGTTVFCLSISFATSVMTAGQVLRDGRAVAIPGWIEADGLSALVVLLASFVCALAAIFAGGYMRHGSQQKERLWWF